MYMELQRKENKWSSSVRNIQATLEYFYSLTKANVLKSI